MDDSCSKGNTPKHLFVCAKHPAIHSKAIPKYVGLT